MDNDQATSILPCFFPPERFIRHAHAKEQKSKKENVERNIQWVCSEAAGRQQLVSFYDIYQDEVCGEDQHCEPSKHSNGRYELHEIIWMKSKARQPWQRVAPLPTLGKPGNPGVHGRHCATRNPPRATKATRHARGAHHTRRARRARRARRTTTRARYTTRNRRNATWHASRYYTQRQHAHTRMTRHTPK